MTTPPTARSRIDRSPSSPDGGAPPAVNRRRGGRLVAALAVAVGLVLGLVGALAAWTLLQGGPVAEASLRLVPVAGNAFSQRSPDPLTDLATDVQSVLSDGVVRAVSADTGIATDRLRDRTSTRIVANSEVLEISYRGSVAEPGQEVVTAFAERYLELRGEREERILEGRRAALVPRVQAAQVELTDAVTAGAEPSETRILSRRLAVLRGELRGMTAPTSEGVGTGSLIRVTADGAEGADLARVALGAAGAALGAALAWLGVRSTRRRAGARRAVGGTLAAGEQSPA